MRNGIFIIGVVFAATLAYIVGNRLSNEAMAVVVGAICGISASIPVSIALFIAASRNWGQESVEREEWDSPQPYHRQPPVVVIAPPQYNQSAIQQSPYYFPAPHPPRDSREFKIIGDD